MPWNKKKTFLLSLGVIWDCLTREPATESGATLTQIHFFSFVLLATGANFKNMDLPDSFKGLYINKTNTWSKI